MARGTRQRRPSPTEGVPAGARGPTARAAMSCNSAATQPKSAAPLAPAGSGAAPTSPVVEAASAPSKAAFVHEAFSSEYQEAVARQRQQKAKRRTGGSRGKGRGSGANSAAATAVAAATAPSAPAMEADGGSLAASPVVAGADLAPHLWAAEPLHEYPPAGEQEAVEAETGGAAACADALRVAAQEPALSAPAPLAAAQPWPVPWGSAEAAAAAAAEAALANMHQAGGNAAAIQPPGALVSTLPLPPSSAWGVGAGPLAPPSWLQEAFAAAPFWASQMQQMDPGSLQQPLPPWALCQQQEPAQQQPPQAGFTDSDSGGTGGAFWPHEPEPCALERLEAANAALQRERDLHAAESSLLEEERQKVAALAAQLARSEALSQQAEECSQQAAVANQRRLERASSAYARAHSELLEVRAAVEEAEGDAAMMQHLLDRAIRAAAESDNQAALAAQGLSGALAATASQQRRLKATAAKAGAQQLSAVRARAASKRLSREAREAARRQEDAEAAGARLLQLNVQLLEENAALEEQLAAQQAKNSQAGEAPTSGGGIALEAAAELAAAAEAPALVLAAPLPPAPTAPKAAAEAAARGGAGRQLLRACGARVRRAVSGCFVPFGASDLESEGSISSELPGMRRGGLMSWASAVRRSSVGAGGGDVARSADEVVVEVRVAAKRATPKAGSSFVSKVRQALRGGHGGVVHGDTAAAADNVQLAVVA